MFTKFEHFAATSLMGSPESPPRQEGYLYFQRGWERLAFALAIALSKKGCYEWEDFRQQLISAIADWENKSDGEKWDYYQRWLLALEHLAIESNLLDSEEIERETQRYLEDYRTQAGCFASMSKTQE